MGETSYIPVWKRMRKVRQNCIVANCSSEGVKGTALIPNSVTCEVFECSIEGDDSVIYVSHIIHNCIMFGLHLNVFARDVEGNVSTVNDSYGNVQTLN